MAQETKDEKKKGALPIPLPGGSAASAAFATGGSGIPAGAGLFTILFAGTAGKAALAGLIAATSCCLYGISLAVTTLTAAPERPLVQAQLSAPNEKRQAQITPQDSMNVLPMSPEGNASAVAQEGGTGLSVALPPAPAGVAGPQASAAAAAAAALAAAGAVPGADGSVPNHIAAKPSALKAPASALPKAVATDGGIGKAAPARPAASATPSPAGAVNQSPNGQMGSAQGFGTDPTVDRRSVASAGRAGTPLGGSRSMRQLKRANNLRGGSGEAGSTQGSQVFDGAAGSNQTVASAPPGVAGSEQKKMGTASDYGEDGAPMTGADPQGGGGFAPPPDSGHTNATPWQKLVEAGTMLMLGASVFLLLEMFFASMKNAVPYGSYYLIAAEACAAIAAAMGLAAVAIGIKIMTMGQTSQGLIGVLGGGLVAVMAIMALWRLFHPVAAIVTQSTTTAAPMSQELAAGAHPMCGPTPPGPLFP